jgi:hypothetical protein
MDVSEVFSQFPRQKDVMNIYETLRLKLVELRNKKRGRKYK